MARSRLLRAFSACLLIIILCQPFGAAAITAAPATPTGADASSKIIVQTSATATLRSVAQDQGVLLADYGSFSLWRVSAASAAKLKTMPGVSSPTDFDTIYLRDRQIDTRQGPDLTVPSQLRQVSTAAHQLWLVQFVGPTKDEWLAAVAKTGAEIVAYMPNNTYVVWADGKTLAQLDERAATGKDVQWTGAYHPAYRLSPQLLNLPVDEKIDTVNVTIQLYTTADIDRSLAALRVSGGAVYKAAEQVLNLTNITLQVRVSDLAQLASQPDVFNIEPWAAPVMLDERQNQIIAGNITTVGTSPNTNIVPSGPGYLAWLSSQGLPNDPSQYPIVDVVDDGIDNGSITPLHPDFYLNGIRPGTSRISYIGNCTTDATGNGTAGHGNLNAGIVGGYNNSVGAAYVDGLSSGIAGGYRYGLGVAPYTRLAGTKIFSNAGAYSIVNCGDTDTGVVAVSYNGGAAITSNSWGCGPGGFPECSPGGVYSASSQAYDAMTRDASSTTAGNQQMLHVFSAGNSGPGGDTIGNPATAKNVIAVGATENTRDDGSPDRCGESSNDDADDVVGFSSRGPTDDGRNKPDIMAPGSHIIGPASQEPGFDGTGVCGPPSGQGFYYPLGQTLYTWSSGTSHSAPAVAGAASLLHTYYRIYHGGVAPSPAMLKAYMLNSTRYLSGAGTGGTLPSNNQGWGDVYMKQAFNQTSKLFFDQETVFGATGEEFIQEGTIATAGEPFRVSLVWTDAPGTTTGNAYVNNLDLEVTVNGQIYKGNVFSGASSATGGSFDAKNNVENVYLPAGTSGAFSVKVTAANIPGDGVPGNADSTDQDFALVIYNAATGPEGALVGTVKHATNTPIAGAQIKAGNRIALSDATGRYTMTLPIGTYPVTATLVGYSSQTVPSVIITENVTTTQDFVLSALPPATVQGVVTDSAHGWPLYARIDITSDLPTQTIHTNPATGAYSVELIQGVDYNFTVQAISAGYTDGTRTVTPTAATSSENFVLAADVVSCNAPGYSNNILISEDFSSGALPTGWSNIDNISAHQTPQAWRFNNPGVRTNLTGGTGGFAILDSDNFGQSQSQNAELRTPSFSTLGISLIQLEFDTDFRYLGGETADVDVSVDGGTNWTNVWKKTAAYRGPKHEVVNISATAANQASVMVRFRYYNATWEWWWQVDNVAVGNPTCSVVAGGLLVGNVIDGNTTTGINGATVASVANPALTTTTIETLSDPNVADGFYTLFSPALGAQSFSASKSGYITQTQTPTIVANSTVVQNFVLGAGNLAFSPSGLTVTLSPGQTANRTLFITNTGSVAAEYTLTEYVGNQPASLGGWPHINRDSNTFSGTTTNIRDTSSGFSVGPRPGTEGPLVPDSLITPWVTTVALPTGLSRPGAAIVNSKVYVIGGESTGGVAGGVAIYDPTLVAWSAGPTMGVPTSNVCAAAVGTDIYALGGTDAASVNTSLLQVLHTSTNTWETVATDPLPGLRFGAACTTYNGKIYMFGGDSGTTASIYVNTAYVYDPAAAAGARWTALANMPIAAHFGGAIAINGKIYYAGMRNATIDLASVFAFDVAAGTWATLPSLQTARGGANVWAKDSILYVGGGGWASYLTSVEAYDTSAVGTWSYTNSLSQGRRAFAAVTDTANGILYAVGGWAGTYLASVEVNRGSVDVLWLSETPTSGTLNPAASQTVNVAFDATGLTVGTYYAQLKLTSNTPYSATSIPVTLIVGPETVSGVAATASTLAQSGAPGELVSYTVTVTNTGNTVDSFAVELAGNSWTTTRTPTSITNLAAGQSTTVTVQVTIPANAVNNAADTVGVTVTSQADNTKSSTVSLTTTASITEYMIFLPLISR